MRSVQELLRDLVHVSVYRQQEAKYSPELLTEETLARFGNTFSAPSNQDELVKGALVCQLAVHPSRCVHTLRSLTLANAYCILYRQLLIPKGAS